MRQVRILQIMVGMESFGGAEKFVYEYYLHMDRTDIKFDFLFCNKNVFGNIMGETVLSESACYELKTWGKGNKIISVFRTFKGVYKLLKRKNYDIVHVNSGIWNVEMPCLLGAKFAGVKNRIAHSHTSKSQKEKETGLKHIRENFKRRVIRCLATDYFACSLGAGQHLFGNKGVESSKFRIIKNSIETDKYKRDNILRQRIREENNISDDTLLFGHVGRFNKVKNHSFILDVFQKILSLRPCSKLWLIGDGELRKDVEKAVSERHLRNNVIFWGERKDVNVLLQAMDGFIFPSLYEGLSIVLVEAQTVGIPIFASDTISREHKLTDSISFLPLGDSLKWATYILDNLDRIDRDAIEKVKKAGYDISDSAKVLEDVYKDIIICER